jgi:hypothetical protein
MIQLPGASYQLSVFAFSDNWLLTTGHYFNGLASSMSMMGISSLIS